MKQRMGMKYRIYPTPEQQVYLRQIAGCVHLTYNTALE